MSFLISANRLFVLTQSRRLRELIQGKLSIEVLSSHTTAPYSCNLSSETMQVALDAALAKTSYLSAQWDKERKLFIERLLKERKVFEVDRPKHTVHAELVMITAMARGEIKHALPCVGFSKPSCIMCNHYIHAFNEVTALGITTRGSDGKAYPGWFWPSIPGSDGVLRAVFLRRIRHQLRRNFERHARTWW
jgi:hypothetical protein